MQRARHGATHLHVIYDHIDRHVHIRATLTDDTLPDASNVIALPRPARKATTERSRKPRAMPMLVVPCRGHVRVPVPAVLTVLALLLVASCGTRSGGRTGHLAAPVSSRATRSATGSPPSPAPVPTPVHASPSPSQRVTAAAPSAPAPTCPYPGSVFDCDLRHRLAAVQAYLRGRPGTVGIVLRDRRTGEVWRNGYAATPVWTASTVKLGMVVDLLLRDRDGRIHLTGTARGLIHAILHVSDDNAADTLWHSYGRADIASRFPSYGLDATFVPGFERYWGYMQCTPAGLDRLIQYVLTRLPAADRAHVVGEMQHVGTDQQWGVWGAGPAAAPGNKDGWSLEQGGWVVNSVGFAGPGQRYTLAMMNSLNGQGGFDAGRETITHVAALLFAGRF